LLHAKAGFSVRLVAVVDPNDGGERRLADHAWTPDGRPFNGPDVRLSPQGGANAPNGGTRRRVVFDLEQAKEAEELAHAPKVGFPAPSGPVETNIDVFAYLPNEGSVKEGRGENSGAAGPANVRLWHGVPRDSGGNIVLPAPNSVAIDFGVESTGPQPVVFGIAEGEFKVVARGAASVTGLAENQTATLASGPWGSIEATHLPQPMEELKPSVTHRFRLLGGEFPPKTERKALFYDAKGVQIASCGDGPNNPGYGGPPFLARVAPADIASYEIQERPYEFFRFDDVAFDAPSIKAYSGSQGRDHVVVSPIGKVVGVIRPIKDGAWTSSILYAADGTRWLDPGKELATYEYGSFDPWNHPLNDVRSILFEPSIAFSPPTTPTTCEVYAADSPTGPRKERLTTWKEQPIREPITSINCLPTPRPYMRLEIRLGGGTWKTLETVGVDDRMLHAAETASPGTRILEVFIDDDGALRIWRDEREPVHAKAVWRPGKQRIRAVAHLRDGSVIDADFNMSGYSGSPSNERRCRGLEYSKETNGTLVQSGAKNIDIKQIASFEIQVQDLKPVVTIPVHSPVE
jgi:hypothetical protein